MPGVLILEAMAQAAGGAGVQRRRRQARTTSSVYYYVGIDNARFKKPVVPGDQLELEVDARAHRCAASASSPAWRASAARVVAEADDPLRGAPGRRMSGE